MRTSDVHGLAIQDRRARAIEHLHHLLLSDLKHGSVDTAHHVQALVGSVPVDFAFSIARCGSGSIERDAIKRHNISTKRIRARVVRKGRFRA